MHISKIRKSNFLKKEDAEPPILVTIKDCREVNVAMEGAPEDLRPALFFDETEKPLVLNSTNAQIIAKICGSEETDDWAGHKIVLYSDPNISFGGKLVGGIRARAPKTKQPAPAAPKPAKPAPTPPVEPTTDEPADDVPF